MGIGADNSRGRRADPRGVQSKEAVVAKANTRGDRRRRFRHPINRAMIEDAPVGARIADRVTGYLGSWRFIIVQTVIVGIWVIGNIAILTRPFDPYPFILLNLAFSTQAAYAAPLILLAGNRASLRDRLTLEHAAEETDIEDAQNRQLLEGNIEILKRVEGLEAKILELEKKILAAIDAGRA